jgi:electron transfer flavoprotein beta subunit
MKVLVAVKRVVDYNVKVRVKADGSDVDIANVKMSMNPFDEIAVEEAVRLKEAGKASEIVVVSMGVKQCEETLRTAWPWVPTAPSWWKPKPNCSPGRGQAAQGRCDKEQPQLLIVGKQAIDDDANQTGQMAAALLGWAQGTFASKVDVAAETVDVIREIDGGLETVKLRLPAVVTADLRLNEPRFIKLPNIMAAKKKPLDKTSPADLGVDVTPRLKTLKVAEPAKRSAGIKVANAAELVAKLKNDAKVL